MVWVMGLNTNDCFFFFFFNLGIPSVRELIETQVVTMRGRISCMTRNISYNVA